MVVAIATPCKKTWLTNYEVVAPVYKLLNLSYEYISFFTNTSVTFGMIHLATVDVSAMEEEPETRGKLRADPSVNTHRPACGKSQVRST